MKSLFIIVLAGIFTIPAFTQEDSTSLPDVETISIVEEPEIPVVPDVPEANFVIDENQDTTRIRVGKKGIIIIENDKGTQVNIEKIEEDDESEYNYEYDDDNEDNEERSDDEDSDEEGKFKGHWTGFELGLNSYVNSDMSMSLDNTMSFMDLNTSRSWNVNINFLQYGFGLVGDKIGLVTGLGAEWNNYHFDNNNSIQKVNGQIQELILNPTDYPDIQKSRLQTTYLRAPLLLEFQIPAGKKRIYFSAGPVGGVKLFSNTKVVYKINNDKQKMKEKDDYNLSALRYGFTARAGYRGLKLFANYYITPLFEAGKDPELYPFSVGLTLIDF